MNSSQNNIFTPKSEGNICQNNILPVHPIGTTQSQSYDWSGIPPITTLAPVTAMPYDPNRVRDVLEIIPTASATPSTAFSLVPQQIIIPDEVPVDNLEKPDYRFSEVDFPCHECGATIKWNPLHDDGMPKARPSIKCTTRPAYNFSLSSMEDCLYRFEPKGTPMAAMPDDFSVLISTAQMVEQVREGFNDPHVHTWDYNSSLDYVTVFWNDEKDNSHGHSLPWAHLRHYIENSVENVDTVGMLTTFPFGAITVPSQEELDFVAELVKDRAVVAFFNEMAIVHDENDDDWFLRCGDLVFYKATAILHEDIFPQRFKPAATFKFQRSECVCKPCEADLKCVVRDLDTPHEPQVFLCWCGIPEIECDKCEMCPRAAPAVDPWALASNLLESMEPRVITIDVIADTLDGLAKSGNDIPKWVRPLVMKRMKKLVGSPFATLANTDIERVAPLALNEVMTPTADDIVPAVRVHPLNVPGWSVDGTPLAAPEED